MSKFFNFMPSEDGASCLLLYGDIGWECDPKEVVMELMELQSQYAHIDVRINSYGGDVYAGLAIFHALRAATSEVNIYVDGIAASMAGILALCGRPVQMSKYAQLMLHSVSSYVYGNKSDMAEAIERLQRLEATLADIIAPRLSMTPEEVAEKYFDGKDHWITADEALAIGLIDGIYDVDNTPASASVGMSPMALYNLTNNRLKASSPRAQRSDKMNLLEKMRGLPLFAACANEDAIIAKATELARENELLVAENTAMKAAEAARKGAMIDALLDEAQKDGRLPADKRETFKNILESDFEGGRTALELLKPKAKASSFVQDKEDPPQCSTWENRVDEVRGRQSN